MYIKYTGNNLTGSDDHEIRFHMIFAKGDIKSSYCFNITDDEKLESNKSFLLLIDSTSLPSNVIAKHPSSATFTILDDHSKYTDNICLIGWHINSYSQKVDVCNI